MAPVLDLKDRKILYALDFDARMPLSMLAKKVGLSKQVVKYRLDKLRKEDVVQGYYAVIDPSKLGISLYLIYFRFQNMSVQKEKEFVKHLSKQAGVGVNVSVNGMWNHSVCIWAKNVWEYLQYYREIIEGYEKYIRDISVMVETNFYYFKPKQLLAKKNDRQLNVGGKFDVVELDDIDHVLLAVLSENARASLVELGELVGLTPNAVKERIHRFEKKKLILAYQVMINYQKLDFLHYRVFFHLENFTEEKERKFVSFLKYLKPVVSVTKTIGYCEIECRAIIKDIHEFYEMVDEIKSAFPGMVKNIESILYYKFHDALNYYPFPQYLNKMKKGKCV